MPASPSVKDNQAVCPIQTGISERAAKFNTRRSTVQVAKGERAIAGAFARCLSARH